MKTTTLLLLAAGAGGAYYLYTRGQAVQQAAAAAPAVSQITPISTPTGAVSFIDRILGSVKPNIGGAVPYKPSGGTQGPPIYVPQTSLSGTSLSGHVLAGHTLASRR